MPEDENVNKENDGADAPATSDDKNRLEDMTAEELVLEVRKTRGEAKGHRLDKRDLQAKLDDTNSQMSALAQSRKTELERKDDFEELNRLQDIELADLRTKAEEGQRYRESVEADNARTISKLPVHLKELAEDLATDLSPDKMQTWLGKHGDKLTAPTPPNLDGGAGGQGRSGGNAAKMSSDEEKMAAANNMTREEWIKARTRSNL